MGLSRHLLWVHYLGMIGFLVVLSLGLVGCPSSTETTTIIRGTKGQSRVLSLRRQLRSTDAVERKAAAVSLGQMGEDGEKAIRALQRTLLDGKSEVRLAAATALGQIGYKAVPALLYGRKNSNAKVRKIVTEGIHRLGSRRVSALVKALKEPLSQIRQQAAEMLGNLGKAAASAAPALSKCLKDEENDVRVTAIVALRKIGPENAGTANIVMALGQAVKANKSWWRVKVALAETLGSFGPKSGSVAGDLIPLLSDRDKNVYRAAVTALSKMGIGAVKAFKESFVSAPWQAKVRIAKIVALLGPKAAEIVPELSQGLRNSDSDVRKATIQALIKIGASSAPAIPIIKSVLSDPQMSQENWLGCLRVLLAIGPKGADSLKQLLSGENWNLRKKIVEGLGQIGVGVGKHGVPVLIFALKDKEKEVKWIAAMVLRKLKHRAAPAVPTLMIALKAKDETTRKLAAKALGAIGTKASIALTALKQRTHDANASVQDAAKKAITAIKTAKPVRDTTAPVPPRAVPSP